MKNVDVYSYFQMFFEENLIFCQTASIWPKILEDLYKKKVFVRQFWQIILEFSKSVSWERKDSWFLLQDWQTYFSDTLEWPAINMEFSNQHSCATVLSVVIVSSTQIQTQAESQIKGHECAKEKSFRYPTCLL